MSWATSASPTRRRASSTSASDPALLPPSPPGPHRDGAAPLFCPSESPLRRAFLCPSPGTLPRRSPAVHSGWRQRPLGRNRLVSFTIFRRKGKPFPQGFSRKAGRTAFPLVLFRAVSYNRNRIRLWFFGIYMTVAHLCATVSKLFYREKRDRPCQHAAFKKSSPPTGARSPSASSGPAMTWGSTPWPCTPRRIP